MHATPVPPVAAILAIDLAKDVFELGFADAHGRVIQRQRLRRDAFAPRLDNHAPLRIVMEACGSAHHWARRFIRLGHRVELLPAHDVRPYVRRNKTDRNDVDGLLEAARCPGIRPVPVKTPEQQGIQGLHRIREHHKHQRYATERSRACRRDGDSESGAPACDEPTLARTSASRPTPSR